MFHFFATLPKWYCFFSFFFLHFFLNGTALFRWMNVLAASNEYAANVNDLPTTIRKSDVNYHHFPPGVKTVCIKKKNICKKENRFHNRYQSMVLKISFCILAGVLYGRKSGGSVQLELNPQDDGLLQKAFQWITEIT